jgi:hypothetical protein
MIRLAATAAPLAVYLVASCLFAESDRATRLGARSDTAPSASTRHAPKDEDRAATVDRRSRSLASKPLLEALHCGNIGFRRLCSKVVRSGLPTALKGKSFAAQFATRSCCLGELRSSRPAELSFYLLFCTWLV